MGNLFVNLENIINSNIKRNKPGKKIWDGRYLLILVIPAIFYYIVFHYLPMWGVLISFKEFSVFKGFAESEWVGMKYFQMFINSPNSLILLRNTFLLSLYTIVFGFPAPIIFALTLNEVRSRWLKKGAQTISYLPHFISIVVVVGMIMLFLSPSIGILNKFIEAMGYEKINFLSSERWFRTIYVVSDIWQGMGWGSIIYLAAITNIDQQLYESSYIDGANKFHQIIKITIPMIIPTVVTLLILRVGQVMSVGFEKVLLLQNPSTYAVSDVIQTFVYRQGLLLGNFSYATAVGLLNSLINLIFLLLSNSIAKKINETSLW